MATKEEEARAISERTKDALAAYKALRRVSRRLHDLYPNGVPADVVEATAGKLGASLPQCRNLTDESRVRGHVAAGLASRRAADEAYSDLVPDLVKWRSEGLSQQTIADRLNADGHTTRQGKPWSYVQVARVLRRSSTI